MQNLTQVIDLQRADAAVVPNAVQCSRADVVFVRQRVGAFARFSQGFPKRGIDNHVRHQVYGILGLYS